MSRSIFGTTPQSSLAEINQKLKVQAVDACLYDTSLDSDGGAWRQRTQHTSWYQESLGTATRGNRQEFPAIALIVAEAQKVTIYDADDPSLPMWMVLEASNAGFISAHGGTSSVRMLNGRLVVGDRRGSGVRYGVGGFWGDETIC